MPASRMAAVSARMCATLIPCPLCSQPHFATPDSLRVGLVRVATGNLVCPVCDEVFAGLDKLTIHLFGHCETALAAETRASDESYQLEFHKVASRDQTQPNVASMDQTQPNVAVPPAKDTIRRNQKILSERCDICGFYFLGKNILQVHKKLIHDKHESNNNEVKEAQAKHACHMCHKTFKMRGSLMVHLRMVHPEGGSKPDQLQADHKQPEPASNDKVEMFDRTKVEQETRKNETVGGASGNSNKQWKCDICQKLFTTKYFLKKHKRLHTGEMPYSCNQCNKTFTFQQSYHKHLLYHNDDKPHTCTYCGRSFKELSTLHNHQRIHTGEKPFACESCGKCFRQRVSYLVHRRIHTGVMPYKCTACDKSFRYKVSQRTHKCTFQPPGLVVRQSGELVQKLIKIQTETTSSTNSKHQDDDLDVVMKRDEEDGKRIIEDLINDSIKSIDFGEPTTSGLCEMISQDQQSIPSPSTKLRNLRLTSHHSPESFRFQKGDVFGESFVSHTENSYSDNIIFDEIYK